MQSQEGAGHVSVTVHAVLPDPNTDTQIVLLKDAGQDQILPIWVGTAEGNAIRLAMEGIVAPRPMSHDLLRSLAEHLTITLSRVIITDVKNNTYYATLCINAQGTEQTIDARPSDAVAFALRMNAPIFVAQEVFRLRGGGNLEDWREKLELKHLGKQEA
jgi:bifunctional DNase/RNase